MINKLKLVFSILCLNDKDYFIHYHFPFSFLVYDFQNGETENIRIVVCRHNRCNEYKNIFDSFMKFISYRKLPFQYERCTTSAAATILIIVLITPTQDGARVL